MKRSATIVTLVMIAAVLLSACGGGGGASPSTAAKAWFDAFTQFDFNKMKDLTCSDLQDEIEQALSLLGGGQDLSSLKELLTIDTSGLKYEDRGTSGNTATVHVSGNFKVTAFGQSQDQPVDEDIPMVNENGQWKVCSVSLPG